MADDLVVFHNGETHNMAWMKANYGAGIEVRRSTAANKFKLIAVNIMTDGTTNLRLWVKDVNGQPKIGQPTTYSFPDPGSPSGELPYIPEAYKSRWSERGVLNKNSTGGDGRVDFQIGDGSWIRGGKGPYTAWVLSPSIESDAMVYTGWKMGTNHEGPVELFFQQVSGTTPEPEPPDEPDEPDEPGEPGEPLPGEVVPLLQEIVKTLREGFRL